MILAIDFDHTLASDNPEPGYRMGVPESGAIAGMKRLANEGHTLIIFTARNVQIPAAYKAVEDWLVHFDIPYHGITNIKRPEFEVMIDDRGLRFHDWPRVLSDLRKIESESMVSNLETPNPFINDITKFSPN